MRPLLKQPVQGTRSW